MIRTNFLVSLFITTTFSENLPVDVDVPPVAVAVLPVAVTTSVMLFPPFVRVNSSNGVIRLNFKLLNILSASKYSKWPI